MLKTKIYNIEAQEVGEIELNESVFGADYNEALIHQVVVAQLANKRQGTKSTLTRAEVRGGGIKPWRQKGTGRARQGSIRAPQWIKGGVVFAPKPRDFSQKVNRVARRNALKSTVSKKLTDGELIIIEDIVLSAPKTKEIATILKNFGIDTRVLLVVGEHDADILRAGRNIPTLTICEAALMNVYDVVANAKCIMSKSAVEKLQEVLA